MTTRLALIKPDQSAQMLAQAYTTLDSVMPGPIDAPPALLLVQPPAWNNRYQSLLYAQAGPRRYATLGVANSKALRDVSWPGPIILHGHWFAGVFTGCQDEIEAAERLAQLRRDVEEFRARTGARLLWTAHNVFPHGNRFPVAFMQLRKWIFETFDAVHVMQDAHVAVLEEAFDQKIPTSFTVPHMLYQGSQADCVTAQAAKVHFGIAPDTFVFAYFGSIHPYKNLDRMLEAFDRVEADAPRSVAALIGGVPSDPGTVQLLRQGWGRKAQVRLLMKTIPDHEIQHIHRAADVMVLPYGETLNSGAAFMAASFDKPFIMPEGLSAQALEGLGVTRFDPQDARGLETAMRNVMTGTRGAVDDAARARVHPTAVSEAFFDHLDRLLGRSPPTA